jgi:hypothetical protein
MGLSRAVLTHEISYDMLGLHANVFITRELALFARHQGRSWLISTPYDLAKKDGVHESNQQYCARLVGLHNT